MTVAVTERLVLRRFTEADAEAFAAINADPEVTRFVGGPLDRARSDDFLARTMAFWDERGYGRCAVEEGGTLLGYTGLGTHPFVGDDVEIGWRLARHAWGRGLATEAARAVVKLAFGPWGLDRLVAVMHPDNAATLGVARNVEMTPYEARDGVVIYELTTSRSDPASSGWSRSAP